MKNTAIILLCMLSIACHSRKEKTDLLEVGTSDRQWTGIAIDKRNNAIYVNYPYWSDSVQYAIAQLQNNQPVPFPNQQWNNWRMGDTITNQQFVSVQSIVFDREHRLWVVDPCNPQFKGVLGEGARIFVFDVDSKELLQSYVIPLGIIGKNSYINDIRIDLDNNYAYLTDSGEGGIVMLNLVSGKSRRLFHNHASVKAERDFIQVGNIRFPNTTHSDGIELNTKAGILYYMPLTGEHVYRVPTKQLQLLNKEEQIIPYIEQFAKPGVADGLWLDKKGNVIISAIESSAIKSVNPGGKVATVIQDPNRIVWPDSFAEDSVGNLYFTTSQIHVPQEQRKAYKIYKIVGN